MAGSPRRLALGAVLYRLWRSPAEALPGLLPQGREERLGAPASSTAQCPPSRRAGRPAPRERVAARAHAVDPALPRSRIAAALAEGVGEQQNHRVPPGGQGRPPPDGCRAPG